MIDKLLPQTIYHIHGVPLMGHRIIGVFIEIHLILAIIFATGTAFGYSISDLYQVTAILTTILYITFIGAGLLGQIAQNKKEQQEKENE